jgi:positive regulator of sigma E activity
VHDYVQETTRVEWPMMAHRNASLGSTPRALEQALQFVLSLPSDGPGQQTAQHEITNAIETALDARRQRVIVSLSEVNLVKWICLYLQAVSVLLAIAMVHSDERAASLIALTLFATGVGASVLLIATHDRPFIGQLSVKPDLLLQIIPNAGAPRWTRASGRVKAQSSSVRPGRAGRCGVEADTRFGPQRGSEKALLPHH